MMASYYRDIERDGSLPAIRPSSASYNVDISRRVAFEDERVPRSRSPSAGIHMRRAESPLFQPRPPSPGGGSRRQVQELHDQMKSFKDELQKKDVLIQQLVSMESIPKVNVRSQVDSVRLENMYLGDRQTLETTRSELAAVQVKAEKQQNKIRELENELDIRDVKVKELQLMVETSHENEMRLQNVVESLRGQVKDLEGRAGAFESVAGRSEYTVSALQKESKASQERIVELEGRLRKHLEEKEEAQARLEGLDRKMKEHYAQFSSIVSVQALSGGVPTFEEICQKLSDMVQENAMLKGKLMTLTETLNNSELETKASRETIMRLVSEVGKEQQMHSKYSTEFDTVRSRSRERNRNNEYLRSCLKSPTRNRDRSISRERDVERSARKEMERETNMLKERLEGCQRTIDSMQREIELRDGRLASLSMEIRTSTSTVRDASSQYTLFKEELASLLSVTDEHVHASSDSIKHKIESMVYHDRDRYKKTDALEERARELAEQLETQYELHKTAASRARRAEDDLADLRSRLKSAEGELAAGDVLREGFKTDKEQYMRCLQHLGEVMKMERISTDLGFDMTLDTLIARAQQLVRLEKDALADRSTHIYNLQRKVKSLKEQLESKDLHIDLLRKKITNLEEKLLGKSTLERERDTETVKTRKLEKLAEKYRMKLEDARQENTNLKAQLLGTSEIRVRTLEQRKELEEMNAQIHELENLRKKQAHKIRELKQTVDTTNHSSEENRVVSDNAVQALSSELRTTKGALSTMQGREKQLVDFRNVVARMLGLDINTLAVPDYEIISRLEKLINAHHSHTFTTLSLEEALADMESGFFHGYDEYQNTIGASESAEIRKSRERVKRKAIKNRARSMSPKRRVDPKVY